MTEDNRQEEPCCDELCILCVCVVELKGGTRPLCPYWLQCHVAAVIINVSWCQRVSWWPTSQQSTLSLWLLPKPDLSLSLALLSSIFTPCFPCLSFLGETYSYRLSYNLSTAGVKVKLQGAEVTRVNKSKYLGSTNLQSTGQHVREVKGRAQAGRSGWG